MITYEEALKTAKEKFFYSVDECEECEDCYIFTPKTDYIIDGGGSIIVMKEDGRTLGYTTYLKTHNYDEPKRVRKFDV